MDAVKSSMLQTSAKGVAKAALDCAHRTSTFLSCAFCEQEGHLATPSPHLPAGGLFQHPARIRPHLCL